MKHHLHICSIQFKEVLNNAFISLNSSLDKKFKQFKQEVQQKVTLCVLVTVTSCYCAGDGG